MSTLRRKPDRCLSAGGWPRPVFLALVALGGCRPTASVAEDRAIGPPAVARMHPSRVTAELCVEFAAPTASVIGEVEILDAEDHVIRVVRLDRDRCAPLEMDVLEAAYLHLRFGDFEAGVIVSPYHTQKVVIRRGSDGPVAMAAPSSEFAAALSAAWTASLRGRVEGLPACDDDAAVLLRKKLEQRRSPTDEDLRQGLLVTYWAARRSAGCLGDATEAEMAAFTVVHADPSSVAWALAPSTLVDVSRGLPRDQAERLLRAFAQSRDTSVSSWAFRALLERAHGEGRYADARVIYDILLAKHADSPALSTLSASMNPYERMKTGGPLPEFALPRLHGGGDVGSEYFEGQPGLLHFWATYCQPCREEMPAMRALEAAVRGRMRILSVTMDADLARVRDFQSANPMPWTQAHGGRAPDDVNTLFMGGLLPRYVILDGSGRILIQGWMPFEELVWQIEKLLHDDDLFASKRD